MTNAIIFMGIKHSGKSTQGALLAHHLDCPFIDIDDEISRLEGKSPREIYNEGGKEAFIEAEYRATMEINKKYQDQRIVIATGGGICDNPKALELLRAMGKFVYINVEENIAISRILAKCQFTDGKWQNLPAYIARENPSTEEDIRKAFHGFYERRTETYKKIADIVINTCDKTKQENAKLIASTLGF